MLDRSACAVFSQGKPHEVPWLNRPIQEIEARPSYSHVCGPTKQLAEKVLLRRGIAPQRLKPDSLQGIYVRPEGRTLQGNEFFRKLFSRAVHKAPDEGFSPWSL